MNADSKRQEQLTPLLLALGFTLVAVGYLTVWLPNKAAGLAFIGVEMGEWVKFLPDVRLGQVAASRNLFYLPPITLGAVMALTTAGWRGSRLEAYLMRGVAFLVSLLAFPSIPVILNEPSAEWRLRLIWIGLVGVVIGASVILPRLNRLVWLFAALLALAGALLPTWAYFVMRPVVGQWLQAPVGVGIGVWLNLAGHLLMAGAAVRSSTFGEG